MSIYNNIADVNNFFISCTFDDDDEIIINSNVIDEISNKQNISIQWGKSKNKINAFNRNFPKIDFDIIVAMSDDIRFNIYGFDEMIRLEMRNAFPDLNGLLHFNDQDAKSSLAILYVAGKEWFNFRNQHIYQPFYKSYFCDNEEMEVAKMLGKYAYCNYQILDHLCPGWGRGPKDDLYLSQEPDWEHDQNVFNSRQLNNFGYA
jgi:hypothetical protein